MQNQLEELLLDYKRRLNKAIDHLDYSYHKVLKLDNDVSKLDLEELETWESFSSRFSRVADIFLTKYMRTFFQIQDQGHKGNLIDNLNLCEKQGLIENADLWYHIRELRNQEAHEYTEESLSNFFLELRSLAPHLITLKKILG